MSVIHAPHENELDARQLLLPAVLVLAFLTFVLRLWYLQVVKCEELTERAERTGMLSVDKLAPRGRIVDRNGKLLAGVKPDVVITAVPAIVSKDPETLERVAKLLNLPVAKIKKALKDSAWRPYLPTPICVGASVQAASRIAEAGDSMPGYGVETQPMRYYPDPKVLSHVLGWVWTPSDTDVKRLEGQDIEPAQYVGRDGLEREYEGLLMGTPGAEKMRVDARRRPLRSLGLDHPIGGRELMLGIDLNIQRIAIERLAGRRGAVAAVDPQTGDVLCLASSPTYDSSLFRGGISTADYDMLSNNPDKPLMKRAISGAYQPGSTFKLVTTLAAQLAGKFSPTSATFCPGYYQLGNRKFRCLGRHGAVSFDTALAKSCNTYFADLAVRAGPDAMRQACEAIGLGHRTGIDLPGESAGVIPTLDWLDRNRIHWYGGDTVNFGIGQGYVSLTPIQMACLAAFVANGGICYRPHVLRAVGDPLKRTPVEMAPRQVLGQYQGDPQFWSVVQRGMVSVMESGTGRGAHIPGVVWAGKTGSSEHRRGTRTHGWFIGYAPADNPRIAIAVIVEAAGHGGSVAAPIARDVVAAYLKGPTPKKQPAKGKGAGLEVNSSVQAAPVQPAP